MCIKIKGQHGSTRSGKSPHESNLFSQLHKLASLQPDIKPVNCHKPCKFMKSSKKHEM